MQKINKRIAPNHITELSECEIFVFGSNLEGRHMGGAARYAYEHFGAEWGNGVGPQGHGLEEGLRHGNRFAGHVGHPVAGVSVDASSDYPSIACRKTFICFALSNGIPPDVVMIFTGHCDYKSMKPYIDITESARKDAIKKMEEAFKKK